MKYILILSVCISTTLIGMETTHSNKNKNHVLIKRINLEDPRQSKLIISDNNNFFTRNISYGEETIYRFVIAPDKKNILIDFRTNLIPSMPRYRLFKVNHKGLLNGVYLKNNLTQASAVNFLPNNEQIIYSDYDNRLHLYDIATSDSTQITFNGDEIIGNIINVTFINDDRILAKTISKKYDTYHYGHVLFNIKNLDNVTTVTFPEQSCHKKMLPVLCIPYPKMFTHITDNGRTLQLLDETMNIVASHSAPENSYISAMAIDPEGKNLAIGHSNGTIIIYGILFDKMNEKDVIKTYGIIKSLTFDKNGSLSFKQKIRNYSNI